MLTSAREEVQPEMKQQQLRLAPNPAKEWTRVLLKEAPQTNDWLIVRDIYGREVLRQIAILSSIDTSSIPTGIYYVEYWQAGDLLTTTKLVKG